MKHNNLKYTYNVIGFALIIFLTLRESLSMLLMHTPLQKGTVPYLIVGIIIYILACFIPVVVMENMLGVHPLLFKKVKVTGAAASGAYGYLIILIAGIANSLLFALLKKVGISFNQQVIEIPQNFIGAVLFFIYLCILPPILEEIFVRGLVFNALKVWGIPFAVGISSLVFALMHSSLHGFLIYFVCGVVLAKIYVAFDSIWPCVLLHFINNFLTFVQYAFQQSVNAQSAVFFSVYIYLMAMVLGYAGLKYLQRHKINLAFTFTRVRDIKIKTATFFQSYVAVCAIALLIFIAAYNSFWAIK